MDDVSQSLPAADAPEKPDGRWLPALGGAMVGQFGFVASPLIHEALIKRHARINSDPHFKGMTPDQRSSILEYAQKHWNLDPSDTVLHADTLPGTGYFQPMGGTYGRQSARYPGRVYASSNASPEELAHELGHATAVDSPVRKFLQRVGEWMRPPARRRNVFGKPIGNYGLHRIASKGIVAAPWATAAAGIATDNDAVVDTGLGLSALRAAPKMIEEGVASVKGYRMLKQLGMNPRLKHFTLPYATYMAEHAGPILSPLVAASLFQHLRPDPDPEPVTKDVSEEKTASYVLSVLLANSSIPV
jgi:hypothetical protein